MRTISSVEFRRVYPRLTEPVQVTANGHIIGTWMNGDVSFAHLPREVNGLTSSQPNVTRSAPAFRPAPKPSQR